MHFPWFAAPPTPSMSAAVIAVVAVRFEVLCRKP